MNKKAKPDAYTQILNAIDAGELPPGSRLRESELADRFGVSRTPVREALRQLEAQGLVTHEPHKGAMVACLSYDQLGELYDVRAVVEGLAARLAARHAAPQEIKVLREMIEADKKLKGKPSKLVRSNKLFHAQLHRSSHNRYLNEMLQSMRRSLVLLAGTTLAVPGRGAASIKEHDAIVRAIAARDEAKAETAARTHIANAYAARLRLEALKHP